MANDGGFSFDKYSTEEVNDLYEQAIRNGNEEFIAICRERLKFRPMPAPPGPIGICVETFDNLGV